MMKRVAFAMLLLVGGCDDASRQEEVASRGAEIMTFDLEKTMHVFENHPYGGIQRVVATDASDSTQIPLIRAHLREEAERFADGDFTDPSQIHGEDMPGLTEMSAGADRLSVTYGDLPDGGQIRYSTDDSALAAAVHRWFEAQRSDHGRHARSH